MIFVCIFLFIILVAFSLRYNWWRVCISDNHARVLMYHSIERHFGDKFDKWRVLPKDFEKQIAWIAKNGYKFYTLSELCELSENMPKKAVCITFDDGYADNFTNAYEILKKYGAKATIFLIPNQKENHWEKANTTHLSAMLSSEQIAKMSDIVEFGSHTINHANLLQILLEQARVEIENSKKEVEKITGKICESFAYPYGKYDEKILQITEECGFKNAVIVKRGVFKSGENRLEIKRIGILGTESFFDFWLKFKKIRNKL